MPRRLLLHRFRTTFVRPRKKPGSLNRAHHMCMFDYQLKRNTPSGISAAEYLLFNHPPLTGSQLLSKLFDEIRMEELFNF